MLPTCAAPSASEYLALRPGALRRDWTLVPAHPPWCCVVRCPVCCPSTEPPPNWTGRWARACRLLGPGRGYQRVSRSRRTTAPLFSAFPLAGGENIDPQEVCGAAPGLCPATAIKSAPAPLSWRLTYCRVEPPTPVHRTRLPLDTGGLRGVGQRLERPPQKPGFRRTEG